MEEQMSGKKYSWQLAACSEQFAGRTLRAGDRCQMSRKKPASSLQRAVGRKRLKARAKIEIRW